MKNKHSTSNTINTARPVTALKGIGPALAEKLAKLGIRSIEDMLFHLPTRYENRGEVVPIASLRNGDRAVVEGIVTSANIQFGKRRSLVCRLKDASGTITLRFFYFSSAQQKQLQSQPNIRCFGEISLSQQGIGIIHPEYQIVSESHPPNESHLTAIYPSSEGIQQARWRNYLSQAIGFANDDQELNLLEDNELPRTLTAQNNSLLDTLAFLHKPPLKADIHQLNNGLHPYQRRLCFEELVAFRLSYQRLKAESKKNAAPEIALDNPLKKTFENNLGFTLTDAQKRVLEEVESDLANPHAMLRLIQGDVGSGKTVVAALAALQCITQQYQVALMAPTEILAEQHFNTLEQWFKPLGIKVQLLVSAMGSAEKREANDRIANGECALIVGTHALIQSSVSFFNIGLVIIDEQHRFGVEQRKTLVNKRQDGLHVHQLVMTATPIPRTLAMTFYADLDYSVIDELPAGRLPVNTAVLGNDKRDSVIARISAACADGRQVYWVCTLVEESELLSARAAETTYELLKEQLPDIPIGLVHGRMKASEKQAVMTAFKSGELRLLVATTVIEVGVDVPNASLMIIENAERLGLAQLHQLRGRVGRGSIESHCVLMYQTPLSKNGRRRLDVMRESSDGFFIAEEDLKIRGPGEVLGTRQSGAVSMRLADLERDADLLEQVVTTADKLFLQPARREALIQRWCGDRQDYSKI